MDPQAIRKIELASVNFNRDFATEIIEKPGCIAYLNSEIPNDYYLNFATLIEAKDPATLVTEMEHEYRSRGISPSFYISPSTKAPGLEKLLLNKGYELAAHETWMFFDPSCPIPPSPTEAVIKRAVTDEDFTDFVNVFVEVYSKGEPDDPYQGLSPLYAKFFWKEFKDRGQKDYKSEYFVAYVEGKPVGTATVYYNDEIAGFYSLAVLPAFRRLGIGRALQATRVRRAKEIGVKFIFLVTAVGSRNEKIFPKSGFQTKFNGKLYHHD